MGMGAGMPLGGFGGPMAAGPIVPAMGGYGGTPDGGLPTDFGGGNFGGLAGLTGNPLGDVLNGTSPNALAMNMGGGNDPLQAFAQVRGPDRFSNPVTNPNPQFGGTSASPDWLAAPTGLDVKPTLQGYATQQGSQADRFTSLRGSGANGVDSRLIEVLRQGADSLPEGYRV